MTNLLILPGNQAIRQNPQKPDGFPSFDQQALVPGVTEALAFYKQQGYTIAVCENAGAVEKGITPFLEKLSEMIVLMTTLAPQVDHLIFCTDFAGAFAYSLSKQQPDAFPIVQRLRNQKVLQAQSSMPEPPDDPDSGDSWQDVSVSSFRKPRAGMMEVLLHQLHPQKIVAVWEREEDYSAIQLLAQTQAQVIVQSAAFWRDMLNPSGIDATKPAVKASSPKSPPTPKPQPTATDPRTQWQRFTYVNPLANADKFWTIRLTDDRMGFIVQHGRNGTAGRELPPKLFATEAQAIREYEKILAEKKAAGYK